MSSECPKRPRLAEHVFARRHLAGGREFIILYNAKTDQRIQLGTREWNIIVSADGTRDIEGIQLAARCRGTPAKAPMIQSFFEDLHAAGLIASGPPAEPRLAKEVSTEDQDRPLSVLPGFTLHCDGRGSCCRLYGSILFSAPETARARALQPVVLNGGEEPDRAFIPERGSVSDALSCVTLIDGRCAYLDDTDRCSLHAVGGPRAKPFGCSQFPVIFTDDGETLRASVEVECACVFESIDRPGGEPLISPQARTRGDLPAAAHITHLPARICLSTGARFQASRAEFTAWSRQLLGMLNTPEHASSDAMALCCSLGESLEAHGLDMEHTQRALLAPALPEAEALKPMLDALLQLSMKRASENRSFRAARDLARRAVLWMERAARILLDSRGCEHYLRAPLPRTEQRHEHFYVCTLLFGHRLVDAGAGELLTQKPVSRAFRERAVRMLIARCLPEAMRLAEQDDPSLAADPAARFPLAMVEAAMRAQGIGFF